MYSEASTHVDAEHPKMTFRPRQQEIEVTVRRQHLYLTTNLINRYQREDQH